MKVLVSAPYMQPVMSRFRYIFDGNGIEVVLPPVHEKLSEEALLQFVGDIDGAICGDDRFTEQVLRTAPHLKVISKWGTGIDSIDKDACRRLGVTVCNTPNAFSEPVADTVMGYILCFARNLIGMNDAMKQGTWKKIPGKALHEYTLGIIGVGNVGKVVVRRAMAFGMRILGHDIVEMPEDFLTETGMSMMTKEELLRQSDFISINCTLNPTSYHLVSDTEFDLMQPTAVVINTARGSILDQPALIRALQAERIAGAALDVFEVEPLPLGSPLRQMNNVLLAPHNANSSPEAWEHVHLNTINNLLHELQRKQT